MTKIETIFKATIVLMTQINANNMILDKKPTGLGLKNAYIFSPKFWHWEFENLIKILISIV